MPSHLHRIATLALCTAMLGTAFSAAAQAMQAAADWPQKPVRLVVPYAPGGTADTLGRLIANHLSGAYRQPFIVDNRGGAGGAIGSQAVAKSPADGYTLLVSGIGSHVIAPVDSPKAFNPVADFSHIALLGGPPTVLVAGPALPVKDLGGLIAFVAASPSGLSWASPGQGTHGHLIGELFAASARLNMVHIGYKGAAPAVSDVLAGQVPAAFVTLSSANAHMQAGKLRALAITAEKRLADYPDVPTFAELGYPKLTALTWFGISGPAGMPRALVDKINLEVRHGLSTPAARQQLALEGIMTFDWDAPTFNRFFKSEIERWTPLVRSVDKTKS